MPSVLVVDDETGYRDMLAEHLESRGYEVQTAASGRAAIDLGVLYQPDVLVADWMLKNHIHGLHVSDVLRVANPEMQTVLMTGFPSSDLKWEARQREVFSFIEKPFEPEELEHSVQEAANAEAPVARKAEIAILEVDAEGVVHYTNPTARQVFGQSSTGSGGATLADILHLDEALELDEAVDYWIMVKTSSDDANVWQLRAQKLRGDNRRMVVLRRQGKQTHVSNAVVEMLLGYRESGSTAWPFEGRILAVDGTAMLRKAFVNQIEHVGGGCYAAATPPEALRLLNSDDGIKYVLHEFEIDDFDTPESINSIQAARPDVMIVGTSDEPRRKHFAVLNVDRFVKKPWTVKELIEAIMGRFGDCTECGLLLPLRRPGPDEQGRSWECAVCGSLYNAVLDDTFPEHLHRNARRRREPSS
ncbi:MAG: response regulator [Phycisphaerales bacterium]|nr:MAG: response regulator [Phycisphaerales bacterium]